MPTAGLMLKGLQHSGTNFLQHVLAVNYGASVRRMSNYLHRGCRRRASTPRQDNCCSKHSLLVQDQCTFSPPVTAMILLIRSPYGWIQAKYAYWRWTREKENVWRRSVRP